MNTPVTVLPKFPNASMSAAKYRPFKNAAGDEQFAGDSGSEILLPFARDDQAFHTPQPPSAVESEAKKSRLALICLVGLIVSGTFNRIFRKLQTIPLYNYQLTMNVYSCIVYIIFYFAYILPTIYCGGDAITDAERAVSKRVFAVMGGLDAVTGIMQLFAFAYIPSGALIVLLLQSTIPVSMLISKLLLGTDYKLNQYVGALFVIGGLVVSLLPQLQKHSDTDGGNQLLWIGVLIGSCIPMALKYDICSTGRTCCRDVKIN